MSNIFDRIESVHAATEGWCTWSKAQTLAAIVISTRPEISVEVGVWYGKSLLPVALAHQHIGKGRVIAIDPWMAENSIASQVDPANIEWWKRQNIHQVAYDTFRSKVYELGLQNVVQIERKASDAFQPPHGINLIHVDGNHGDQSVRDIERYAPEVARGGFLVADDLAWSGGSVTRAIGLLPAMGFTELYRVENDKESWACFQRTK